MISEGIFLRWYWNGCWRSYYCGCQHECRAGLGSGTDEFE